MGFVTFLDLNAHSDEPEGWQADVAKDPAGDGPCAELKYCFRPKIMSVYFS